MVKKDILRSSASFPLGSNFLIRGMSSELKCSLDEAKSYLSIFKDGHAEKDTHEKIEAVIKKLKATWLLKFQESLVNISHDISIPSTIFLTTDKDLSEFWTETIKAEQYNQYTLTESKFNVVFLGVNALHGVVNFQENTNRDPLLIIEAIYINHFLF